jgi:hypothetical protein
MRISPRYGRAPESLREGITAMNDNEERPVTIIIGRVRRAKNAPWDGVHLLLTAPDDDTAVRLALTALTREGYVEAELDQIGDMEGEPDEEPHMSAYQGALEGEVSIVMVKDES